VKDQAVFEFNGVNGTLVGFRSPDYINGLNVPGYHMHFITADRSAGGHLLDLKVENATVQLDQITFYDLALPSQGDFYQANLSQDRQEELKEIEGGR
jgi:acetolactate decarboxylase